MKMQCFLQNKTSKNFNFLSRCVQNNQRSYALAVQQFLTILVAFIPTHLVRYIMHRDCHIWQKDPCGRKGICWDYDTNSMSKSMTIFGLVVTGKLRVLVSELELASA